MEENNNTTTMVPTPSETNVVSGDKHYSSPEDSDTFYVKLAEVLDSSGLNLIFNVRETSLDLYLFYLEVTKRGGYYQVGQQKQWGEIVSALKLEGNNANLSAQVEKLYANLLYKFEKLYFYRFPSNGSTKGTHKRKQNNSTTELMGNNEDDLKATKMLKECCSQMKGAGYQELGGLLQASSSNKEMKKPQGADHQESLVILQAPSINKEMQGADYQEPQVLQQATGKKKAMKNRRGQSGYQIFLKQECARLKAYHPDIDGKSILRMAVGEWKELPDIDKQPYINESKKIREKVKEAMIVDNNKQKSTEDPSRDEKNPIVFGGDYYCVSSQPLENYSFVNDPAVELAIKMAEKTSKDPFFVVDLGAYRSFDFSTGGSK